VKPSPDKIWLAAHVSCLLRSFHELTGRHLVPPCCGSAETAVLPNEAPFFVASHGLEEDPVLDFGNLFALDLFEMSWQEFVKTPSRLTAEAPNRAERQRLLDSVAHTGLIDDYSGIRISSTGRRFRICNATVWSVTDPSGKKTGQAATFSDWEFIG
jgi:hypothetical protein